MGRPVAGRLIFSVLAVLVLGFGVCLNLRWLGEPYTMSIGERPGESFSAPETADANGKSNHPDHPLVDIISVGSYTRPEYQDAQQNSFGKHPSIRHFFRVTEADDVDQGEKSCNEHLSWKEVQNISGFCGGMRNRVKDKHPFLYELRIKFANVQWLGRKSNPVGWMCAQKRPMAGFKKVVQFYRENPQQLLPDFLIILDDDTYIQMDRVVQYLVSFQKEKYEESQDDNIVLAGCVIRGRIKRFRWIFPFGGWGTIFSRGTLQTILTPLYCGQRINGTELTRADRTVDICDKLKKDRIGEHEVFDDGMSLADVMYAYVMREPYVDQAHWSLGFCLHSDWVWGCTSVSQFIHCPSRCDCFGTVGIPSNISCFGFY